MPEWWIPQLLTCTPLGLASGVGERSIQVSLPISILVYAYKRSDGTARTREITIGGEYRSTEYGRLPGVIFCR
jgi:hypothetical protein